MEQDAIGYKLGHLGVYHQGLEDEGPGYRVAPVPGKGLGLVATRDYRQGEVSCRLMLAIAEDWNVIAG